MCKFYLPTITQIGQGFKYANSQKVAERFGLACRLSNLNTAGSVADRTEWAESRTLST